MNIIDLFSGPGGLSLGLRRAGLNVLANVELNRDAMETYAAHDSGVAHFNEDVRGISFAQFRGKVDVVVGGPPCQPFSIGGLRKGKADERDMIPEFVRCLEEVQPEAFLMENVPGLTIGNRKNYFSSLLNALSKLGYHISWKVLNAADFGIPQIRRRLFIVGMHEQRFIFPQETHGPNRVLPFVKVKDVLPPNQLGEPNPSKVFYAKNPSLRPNPYHGHLFNGGGRPINLDQPSPTILASAGGNKTHFIDSFKLVPAYHRYLMEGGKPQKGELEGARRLSIVESAILQTFPTDTSFVGPPSARYRQIGNAVPPLLAAILGKALVSQLREKTCFPLYTSQIHSVEQQTLFPIETI